MAYAGVALFADEEEPDSLFFDDESFVDSFLESDPDDDSDFAEPLSPFAFAGSVFLPFELVRLSVL